MPWNRLPSETSWRRVVAVVPVQADVGGMPGPDHQRAAPRSVPTPLRVFPVSSEAPVLDAQTRTRLGRQLRALYDPVIDEMLDPRLAELLQQLDADRADETGR
jgi:hypothetical protein